MNCLDSAEIERILSITADVVTPKETGCGESGPDRLRLVGPFEILVVQLALPIIASVCAASLYDFLKGRKLRSVGREEADGITAKLKGKVKAEKIVIDANLREQMEVLLDEYGLGKGKIDEILTRVMARRVEREAHLPSADVRENIESASITVKRRRIRDR